MNMPHTLRGFQRIKLFFALSRTPHGLLDIATPALAALLWYGGFPPLSVSLLGLVTAFAGYTAVYALNDVIDFRTDREKIHAEGFSDEADYLDDVLPRHPMARGLLSFKEGLAWVVLWSLTALIGAYLLNPVCLVIFLIGCLLEALYCLLHKVTHLRILVSGVVKTAGGMAAVFAVDPTPSPLFLAVFFLWIFAWEVGGQNIPADWADIDQDRTQRAKTIPVRLGTARASVLMLGSLVLAVLLNVLALFFSRGGFSAPAFALALAMGVWFLLIPAGRLYETRARENALLLFTKASFYPAAIFLLVVALDENPVAEDVEQIKQRIRDAAPTSTRARTYLEINPTLEVCKAYSTDGRMLETHRIAVTRIRVSSHRLRIETGRWARIPRENRLCQCGDNYIQTEEHALLQCRLSQEIRERLFENVDLPRFLHLLFNDIDLPSVAKLCHETLELFFNF